MRPGRRALLQGLLRAARATSGAVLLCVAGASSCSGKTAPTPTAFDNCFALCEQYPELGCKFDQHHEDNKIAGRIASHPWSCREWCTYVLANEWPEAPCGDLLETLYSCAARSSFHCIAGKPNEPPAVDECDDASRAVATGCDSCVLLLSSGLCPETKPRRWHCAPTGINSFGSSPACVPACIEIAPWEFCCPEAFWQEPCDPAGAPICANNC
jgi:hypothetical protein